jgi:hypothetical protein
MDQNLAPPTRVGVHSTAHRGQMDVAFKVRATFFSGIGSVGFTNSVKINTSMASMQQPYSDDIHCP